MSEGWLPNGEPDPNYQGQTWATPEEKTRILARFQNDAIRELVIVSMGNEPTLVRIKGKIKPEDVQKLVNPDDNEQ